MSKPYKPNVMSSVFLTLTTVVFVSIDFLVQWPKVTPAPRGGEGGRGSICLMYQRSESWWNRRGLKFGCCSSISPLISILSQSAADPVLPGHKLREREMVSRDSSTKVLPLLWPTILTPSLTRIYHQSSYTKNCCTNTSYWIIQHEYVQSYEK